MAYMRPASAGSGAAPSPSSEGSSEQASPPSPGNNPLSVGSDAGESPRSARTPLQPATDITRSASGGRGGCWTCRVRRKKCDEQRQGDSCQTCIRLKITCLGWGARRPDWMRDKQAVEAYKADIKAQLSRAGLIRGQPRLPRNQSSSPASSQPYDLPGVAGPGPSSLPVSAGLPMDSPHVYVYDPPRVTSPSGLPEHMENLSYQDPSYPSASYDGSSVYLPSAASYPRPQESSMLGLIEPQVSYDTISVASMSPLEYPEQLQPAYNSPIDQNEVNQQHVLYYFEHVRRMQYIFAGESVVEAIHNLIIRDPHGAVTNAVCALASLHYTRLRVPRPPVADREAERATVHFYEQSSQHLRNSLQVHGQYTESDAVAALQLVSFSLFSAGSTQWRPMLDIACEWLAQTGIIVDEDPKLTLRNMTSASRFAAKATMWLDIFSSITDLQPPRFLPLYRRLFSGGAGFWARSRRYADDPLLYDMSMESLTGCPDEVMLAIAEVSALAHWKTQEQQNGTLSVRELIRRGDLIEQQLKRKSDALSDSPVDPRMPSERRPSLPGGQVPLAHSPIANTVSPASTFPSEDMRRVTAEIYRETVVLYLHTVLSDCNPGVPEIMQQVSCIVQLLTQLPPSEADRSLIFPLCLAGCLSDDPTRRTWLRGRMEGHKDTIGNVYQVKNMMDRVWQRRDSHGGPVDWRDIMREQGWSLLLV